MAKLFDWCDTLVDGRVTRLWASLFCLGRLQTGADLVVENAVAGVRGHVIRCRGRSGLSLALIGVFGCLWVKKGLMWIAQGVGYLRAYGPELLAMGLRESVVQKCEA